MEVNSIKKNQNFDISKCGKSQNKFEVTEEIGCGNELKNLCKSVGKNEVSFI